MTQNRDGGQMKIKNTLRTKLLEVIFAFSSTETSLSKGQASRVPLSSADPYIGGIYRLAVQSVAEMGLQGGFTAL